MSKHGWYATYGPSPPDVFWESITKKTLRPKKQATRFVSVPYPCRARPARSILRLPFMRSHRAAAPSLSWRLHSLAAFTSAVLSMPVLLAPVVVPAVAFAQKAPETDAQLKA